MNLGLRPRSARAEKLDLDPGIREGAARRIVGEEGTRKYFGNFRINIRAAPETTDPSLPVKATRWMHSDKPRFAVTTEKAWLIAKLSILDVDLLGIENLGPIRQVHHL